MNTHGSRNPVDSLTLTDHKFVRLAHDYAQTSLIRLRQEVVTEQQEVVLTTGRLPAHCHLLTNKRFVSILSTVRPKKTEL